MKADGQKECISGRQRNDESEKGYLEHDAIDLRGRTLGGHEIMDVEMRKMATV